MLWILLKSIILLETFHGMKIYNYYEKSDNKSMFHDNISWSKSMFHDNIIDIEALIYNLERSHNLTKIWKTICQKCFKMPIQSNLIFDEYFRLYNYRTLFPQVSFTTLTYLTCERVIVNVSRYCVKRRGCGVSKVWKGKKRCSNLICNK